MAGRTLTIARIVVAGIVASAGITVVATAVMTAATSDRAVPERASVPVASTQSAAVSEPTNWTVVALGDSVTAGTACDCTTFTDTYAELLRERSGHPVIARNLGRGGLTTATLHDQLRPGTPGATEVAAADIVLVTIGANDLGGDLRRWQAGSCDLGCFDADLPGVGQGVAKVLADVHALRSGRPTQILVTTYWNVFEDGQEARRHGAGYARVSDEVTRSANRLICAATDAAGDTCVDLYAPFKGDGDRDPTALLAADGDHPDGAGHDLIARTLADAGWAALRSDAPAS